MPFRLPDATHLGPVHLRVSDLDRSLHWYETVVGLVPLGKSATTAVLGAPDGTPLIHIDSPPGTVSITPGTRLGLYHVAVRLPDRPALGRLLRHLLERREPLGASDHLVSEALYLTDPDGLGLEVYVDRPRASWRMEGDQLAMATDPLDGEGLLRAAGDATWTTVPAGTDIGHVHLHVGDLSQASRFYADGLGFDRMVWRYPGALFLGAGGYHHHLGTNVWARGATPPAPHEARLLAWTVVLPDAVAVTMAVNSLAAVGAELTSADDGVEVADPWGTHVRITTGALSREGIT